MAAALPVPARWSSSDFAALVHEPLTEIGRLQRGVELAVTLVDGCDHAGVTVLTPAFMETVAASDDVVRRGDDWQHQLSEGPGLDSVRGRTAVLSQDVRVDRRWRTWGPRAAADLGVRSTLSILLGGRGVSVASLTFYSDRVAAWDGDREAHARALADQLALAADDARELDVRDRALVARSGLSQAQGIVMERFGLSADEAYDRLQQLSASTHVALVHLAEHIVVTRTVPALPGRADTA